MFRRLCQPSASLYRARRIPLARQFHDVTADFLNYDARGSLITKKIPIVIGDPGQTYIMVYPEVGNAIRAAADQSRISTPAGIVGDICKLTFFHDSQHFGLESSGYPRLYVPQHISRLSDSDTSPATLFLSGAMQEIALDGTPDAQFAYQVRASAWTLRGALDRLKDM